jgi:hypothetical protein
MLVDSLLNYTEAKNLKGNKKLADLDSSYILGMVGVLWVP